MQVPNIIFLGAPGSGKGTQAQKLVEQFHYSHISTGDLLRAEIAKQTDLGKRVKGTLDAGKLVDDQMVLELLKANCNLNSNTYIFDGFPRTLQQAKMLDEQLLTGRKSLALYLKIDLKILIERLVNRRVALKSGRIYNLITNPPKAAGVCDVSGEALVHRNDDKEDVVKNRLTVYLDNIEPVIGYYEKLGLLRTVDAQKDMKDVWSSIRNAVSAS
jgi:adenylate kinase